MPREIDGIAQLYVRRCAKIKTVQPQARARSGTYREPRQCYAALDYMYRVSLCAAVRLSVDQGNLAGFQ